MRQGEFRQRLVHVVLPRPVLEARPEPVPEAAIPAWRSACVITLSPSMAPGREPGNT